MKNETIDLEAPGAQVLEPRDVYDAAVIGLTFDGRAIYDRDLVVELTVTKLEMPEEDALEWHEFNTFCAYNGPKTPLFGSFA